MGGRQRKGGWAAIFLPSLADLVSASLPLQSIHRIVSRIYEYLVECFVQGRSLPLPSCKKPFQPPCSPHPEAWLSSLGYLNPVLEGALEDA